MPRPDPVINATWSFSSIFPPLFCDNIELVLALARIGERLPVREISHPGISASRL
jgi:hypothetical protein